MKLTPEANPDYFETIIFDLDGVIIDSAPDICAAVQRTLTYLGSESRDYEYIKNCIGGGARNVLLKTLGETQKGLIDEAVGYFKEDYLKNCANQTALYPGVAEIL
ncbi:MAG: HAD hydrolase-like protein, partial [Bacillota bacterium]